MRTGSKLAAAGVGGLAFWAILAVILYYVFVAIGGFGDEEEWNVFALYAGAGIGFFVGVPLGAVAGVLAARRPLKENASYRETLLGAVAGMLTGALLGGVLVVLSNSFGMDWWDQDTELAVFPVIPFLTTIVAAVKASDWVRWWNSRSAKRGMDE